MMHFVETVLCECVMIRYAWVTEYEGWGRRNGILYDEDRKFPCPLLLCDLFILGLMTRRFMINSPSFVPLCNYSFSSHSDRHFGFVISAMTKEAAAVSIYMHTHTHTHFHSVCELRATVTAGEDHVWNLTTMHYNLAPMKSCACHFVC